MGINVSKSMNNVSEKIINELEQSLGASATANCSVITGNIILKNANRCGVRNENRCSANASAAMEAISRAAANAWLSASNEQKSFLLPGINVNETEQNVSSIILSQLKQKCQANSALTQSIATGDLILDGCIDSYIYNINSGSAEANCAIKSIMNTIIEADIKQQSSQGNIFSDIFSYIGFFGIFICVLILIILILLYFRKN